MKLIVVGHCNIGYGGAMSHQLNIENIGKVAKILIGKVPRSKTDKGQRLRLSSATLVAHTGAHILELKRHGGWKSSTVTEGYVEQSLVKNLSVAK